MFRTTWRVGLVALLASWVSASATAQLRAGPPPERLLPATATEFVAFADFQQALTSFCMTQYGRVFTDPHMQPFVKDFLDQLARQGDPEFLGFSICELAMLADGECVLATIPVGPRQPAKVVLVKVAGKADDVDKAIKVRARRWQEMGGTERRQEVLGLTATVQEKAATDSSKAIVRAHLVKDDFLVLTDDLKVLEGILGRWAGSAPGSLAEHPAFKAIMAQTAPRDKEKPQIRFYYDLFRHLELTRTPPNAQAGEDLLAQLKKLGFDGIRAAGGFVAFAHPDYDIYYRAAIYAPPPYQKGMRVVKLPLAEDLAAEDWVPARVGNYTTLSVDWLNVFDNLDPIFDLLAADNRAGTFQKIVADTKDKPDGPQVDLRREFVVELGNRVTLYTDSVEPLTRRSAGRRLIAIPARNEKAVADVVRRLLKDDSGVVQRRVGNYCIWELPPTETVELHGDREEIIKIPGYCVCVARGCVFVCSHTELMEVVLRKDIPGGCLCQCPAYRRVQKEVERLGGTRAVAYQFRFLAEDFRALFEQARTNQVAQADSVYSRLVSGIVPGADQDAVKPNAALLPEFKKVSHYLGAAGSFARPWADGWEVVGFVLKKNQP